MREVDWFEQYRINLFAKPLCDQRVSGGENDTSRTQPFLASKPFQDLFA